MAWEEWSLNHSLNDKQRVIKDPREQLLDEVTFDKLRPYFSEDEVNGLSLSVVIHRIRKIIRDE